MRLSSNKHRQATQPQLSATSMIDVVFLLLIFFLVTSTFVKPEKEYRPSIQVNEKSSASKSADLEKAIVEIVLHEGEYVYQIGAVQTDDPEKLIEILKSFSDKSQGAFVRAPNGPKFEMVALACAACRTAKFATVTYIPLADVEE